MTMFFAKKLNKKGFTLAELLVVIAIIAVLIAIAVPIFTSSLSRARIAAHQANARALKAAAIVQVLNDKNLLDPTAGTPTKAWEATAQVDKDGNFDTITVKTSTETTAISTVSSSATATKTSDKVDSDAAGAINPAGAYYFVVVTASELTTG